MSTINEMRIHVFDQDSEDKAKAKADELRVEGYKVLDDAPKLVRQDFAFNPTQSTMCTDNIQVACSQVLVVIAEKV